MCSGCSSIGRNDQKCSECQDAIRRATKTKKKVGSVHRCFDYPKCKNMASGKNLFCSKCWDRIPKQHKATIREGTEKGTHTLRVVPSREWTATAYGYLDSAARVVVAPVDPDVV
jgi:hypothetical protein